MSNTTGFKSFIRTGAYTEMGYPVFMIAGDNGCLCYGCAKDNAKLILQSTRQESYRSWEFASSCINWDDHHLFCDNCNGPIEAACAE